MLGKIEGERRRGWQRMRWLNGIINSTDTSLSRLRELMMHWEAQCTAVHGVTKSEKTEQQNWTELIGQISLKIFCCNWLRQSIMVGNMRKRKKGRENKGTGGSPCYVWQTVPKQPEKNSQRDTGEKCWACYYSGKEGHLKRDCLQASKLPPAPCPVCKEPH